MDDFTRRMIMGAAGGSSDKTYVDDVFSTYLYRGNDSTITVNNGIDISTESGLVWVKNRTTSYGHFLFDTARGTQTALSTNLTNANFTETKGVTSFNTNGFTIGGSGGDAAFNSSSHDYASWTFRKAPGFFDVVKFTGTGGTNASPQTIDHSLESIPGMIIIKNLTQAGQWFVYHKSTGVDKFLQLNKTDAAIGYNGGFKNITSSSIDVFDSNSTNTNEFIAYVFAGGASTAATAKSVDFDGSGDYLSAPNHPGSSDFTMGTGDFTIEGWVKHTDANNRGLFYISNEQGGLTTDVSGVIGMGNNGNSNSDKFQLFAKNSSTNYFIVPRVIGQWYHFAVVRASSVLKVYINGLEEFSTSDTTNYNGTYIAVGGYYSTSYLMKGNISNFRVVKGTAVYTAAFKPSTEPLTNITNTKLLCCNNSSVTGSTVAPSSANTYSINVTASGSSAYTLSGNDRNGSVSGSDPTVTANVGDTLNFVVNASGHPFYIRVSNGGANVSTPAATNQGTQSGTVSWTPNTAGTYYYQCGNHSGMIGTITINAAGGSITANGNPTASTDSPFDDPKGFKFGEGGDQNIVKTGSYVGNGSNTNDIDVNLGWEPTFLLVKQTVNSGNWQLVDSATHWPNLGNWETIRPNLNQAAYFATETGAVLTPTGFKIVKDYGNFNTNGDTMVYMAIRMPDGYVGKPPELGTDVFAMDTGNGSSTIPTFDSGFPVDWTFGRPINISTNWGQYSRLTGDNFLRLNTNDSQSDYSGGQFDSSVGFGAASYWSSSSVFWMWKRGAGLDVVTYTGDLVAGRQIPHSLNKIPEMIWVKRRNDTSDWLVWNKGLNGGTNSGQYYMRVNYSTSQSAASYYWNNTTQSSTTHFTIGGNAAVNGENDTFIAILFASVDGISKLGRYTGNATDSDHSSGTKTVTFGFQPRMVIIKSYDANNTEWIILDTTRGWASGSGNTKRLRLNLTNAQNNEDAGYPTATGMVLTGNGSGLTNNSGDNYIYYAHA